ncbi:MAG: galactose mutarotase, partial [Clostridia bacterium]|nr:galactose mutarotase [Deltaproteobacteria bacterium]
MKTFGTHGGTEVVELEIVSQTGARARLITWGAALRDLIMPNDQHVVLGFDDLATYVKHSPHAGAIPGRFANRIARGHAAIDGVTYQLDLNQDGKHHRHGGKQGFGKRVWHVVSAK